MENERVPSTAAEASDKQPGEISVRLARRDYRSGRAGRKFTGMKLFKPSLILALACGWLVCPTVAAEKTCCEKARAAEKECPHPCCVTAHKAGKSCEKCNPNREDVKGERTCCEKARAEGKDCPHKCCIAAKKDGKNCEKCHPRKKAEGKKSDGPSR